MDLGFGPEEGASGVIVAFNESVDVGHEFLTLAKEAPLSDEW